jgi:hypothetical protein
MYNFAELMLPDGAHKRDEDTTLFMLRRTPLVKSSSGANNLRQPPPPPAPRISSACKFPDVDRAYEAEHKSTLDTLHALLCYNGAELARALWSKMSDDASNQLYTILLAPMRFCNNLPCIPNAFL